MGACHGRQPAPSVAVDAAPPAPSVAPSASASSPPAPSASAPSFDDPSDVRVVIPLDVKKLGAPLTSTVKVGQRLGVLLPKPSDWLDEWEVQSCAPEKKGCPLGEPFSIVTRENDLGHEVMWTIPEDKVGTHTLVVRLIHRKMRTDPGVPTIRARVVVTVVR